MLLQVKEAWGKVKTSNKYMSVLITYWREHEKGFMAPYLLEGMDDKKNWKKGFEGCKPSHFEIPNEEPSTTPCLAWTTKIHKMLKVWEKEIDAVDQLAVWTTDVVKTSSIAATKHWGVLANPNATFDPETQRTLKALTKAQGKAGEEAQKKAQAAFEAEAAATPGKSQTATPGKSQGVALGESSHRSSRSASRSALPSATEPVGAVTGMRKFRKIDPPAGIAEEGAAEDASEGEEAASKGSEASEEEGGKEGDQVQENVLTTVAEYLVAGVLKAQAGFDTFGEAAAHDTDIRSVAQAHGEPCMDVPMQAEEPPPKQQRTKASTPRPLEPAADAGDKAKQRKRGRGGGRLATKSKPSSKNA